MFSQYNTFFLQKTTLYKLQRKIYTISANNQIIGKIEETASHKKITNQLVKLVVYQFISFDLQVLDSNGHILGWITKKQKGITTDFHLLSNEGDLLATVQPKLKLSTATMTVIDKENKQLIQAKGDFGAIHYTVEACKNNTTIASIQKRSLIYDSIQDSIHQHDGYYITMEKTDALIKLALLAIGIMIDVYIYDV
ncbi:hypothetical protein CAI16_12165 [Virgibacillus dokdonensis]|uniref:Scramblase n=1 Tax=Virgibacillus dokdonensis TaxID=302167 RepID=A0A3E0WQI9_9BACI|nr:hypothetical protein [Virgibacillus dokdonensis]RFA34235.1 hypothetical protein CAI16_12165 [Virgibacillus dokdonensis]